LKIGQNWTIIIIEKQKQEQRKSKESAPTKKKNGTS